MLVERVCKIQVHRCIKTQWEKATSGNLSPDKLEKRLNMWKTELDHMYDSKTMEMGSTNEMSDVMMVVEKREGKKGVVYVMHLWEGDAKQG